MRLHGINGWMETRSAQYAYSQAAFLSNCLHAGHLGGLMPTEYQHPPCYFCNCLRNLQKLKKKKKRGYAEQTCIIQRWQGELTLVKLTPSLVPWHMKVCSVGGGPKPGKESAHAGTEDRNIVPAAVNQESHVEWSVICMAREEWLKIALE